MHFHASFFLVPAAFFFLLGGGLGWFTERSVFSIGLGIAAVIFVVWVILEQVSTHGPPNLEPHVFTIAAFVAILGGVPGLIGGTIGRAAKRRNST
ncbi:MAG: hypothetical protein QNJ15_13830 [Erythrobacter sp.]|nr:hypothetical protein [Erythrobacter sp.]